MSDPATINYQPLQAMKNASGRFMLKGMKGYCLPLTIIILAASVAIGILSKSAVLGSFLALAWAGVLVMRINAYKNRIWDSFAAANGWALDSSTAPDSLLPPSLDFGHSQHFSPIIKAIIGQLNVDLFFYTTTTGSGKYQQTHYFTVAELLLPKQLPHILLSCKKGKADVQNDIPNSQTLKLEGNFDDYFKLQIEAGQQIDVLTILTPDVMQTLVDYSQAEDIEVSGTGLWFIVRGDSRDASHVQQLITSVVKLTAQITENLRLSTPQVPTPVAMPVPTPPSAPTTSPAAAPNPEPPQPAGGI